MSISYCPHELLNLTMMCDCGQSKRKRLRFLFLHGTRSKSNLERSALPLTFGLRKREMSCAFRRPCGRLLFSRLLDELSRSQPIRQCWSSFGATERSEEHTSELQYLMRISYAVLC